MAFKPTPSQEKAIFSNGNILVSAAAGSGKTAVLVERVINKLCDKKNGISADKLLIVTFTNAAAAEMRSRIEKRLDEEIRKNPSDTALTFQKHLLQGAKICTIDSFCIDLVRENFEKLGIEPDFKISDSASLTTINYEVLNRIVSRYLEEKNAHFLKLLDIFGCEFDEQKFLDIVLNLYDYSRQLPFPEKWFSKLRDDYLLFNKDNIWWNYSFDLACKLIIEAVSSITKAFDLIAVNEKANEAYFPAFSDALGNLKLLLENAVNRDWDSFYSALSLFSLPSLPTLRGVSDIYEITAAKEIYKSVSSKTISRISKLFYSDSSSINKQFAELYPIISLLSDILIEFDQELFAEYIKNNTFTFHNTEHLALKLLCDENESSKELLERFDEVLVDEYQDTNDLQDMLFYVLSSFEKKLFVVGDVKQSIYGFRGANPKNFLNKKNRYIDIDKADKNSPQKIILGNNFRCHPEACEFINYFFKLFMNEQTGDILYNGEEELVSSAVYPKASENACEIHILDSKNSSLTDTELEAIHIANYIKEVMKSGKVIKESDDTLRNAKYSDFSILLRSAKLKAGIIAEELKRQGIPVTYSSEEFADTTEISLILSLLKVLDNPENDVELLTVLMSPIFLFTADELAELRALNRKGNLYSCIISGAQNENFKAKEFLERIEKLRMLSVVESLPRLISRILYETGYIDIVSAMDDGIKRRENLLLLLSYAEKLSGDTFDSIPSFIKYISKNSSGTKGSVTSQGNAVRIMSIHASKGLQFPVCIVAGLGSKFNDNEAHEPVLYKTDFGIGFKYFDEKEKQPVTSIAREAILDKIRAERLEEELRLFYVALTRTQDKLVMIGTVSDAYKKANELKTQLLASSCKISFDLFNKTKSYLEWLILSLLLLKSGKELRGVGHSLLLNESDVKLSLRVLDGEQIINDITVITPKSYEPDTYIVEKLKENLEYKYPFSEIAKTESKASVSMLANSAQSEKYSFTAQPSFLSVGGITATERGTAMHKVMQFFDFSKYDSIEEELERLYEWQYISEREYKAINVSVLKRFFESEMFNRIKNAININREMRFLTEMQADIINPQINASCKNEKIIVQGAVDLCFEEQDGIVILDFKTDRVDDITVLKDTYAEQLNIYALACEKIFKKPVKQKIIYSFAKQDIICV